MSDNKILKINKRSFIIVCCVLAFFCLLAYALTFILEPGIFENGEYFPKDTKYSFFDWITSPVRLIFTKDGLNFIILSLFILIISGAFNIMDKTGGISSIINTLIEKFKNRKFILMYLIILIFMLFGSLFGIFEEAVTLLPIIILLALSLGFDTFTGLGMCLLAAGFGFSSAITNPFSVGLGSEKMEIAITDGFGYRVIIFIVMYLILCLFMTIHVKKIMKKPESSLTYESDQQKRAQLLLKTEVNKKALTVYSIFFMLLFIIIILSSILPFLQGLSIPIIAIAFLIGSLLCGLIVNKSINIFKIFLSGVVAMLPAVIMLLLAGSIKLILDESNIMGTIIYKLSNSFVGKSPFISILFIYFVILVIQFFIGSASAKVILIIPVIKELALHVGITPNIALLAFIFGDGFTDLIYPTNPVLLIALGMAGFSYFKWFKKTIFLQLIVLAITVLLLFIGLKIGY